MKRLVLILVLLLLVACDHTDLTGEIQVTKDIYGVDEMIPLRLVVPEDLEEIHRVMWHANRLDSEDNQDWQLIEGEDMVAVYEESTLLELFDVDELNFDRMALLIPDLPGTYVIDVSGFYKQTNPQGISSIEITVE